MFNKINKWILAHDYLSVFILALLVGIVVHFSISWFYANDDGLRHIMYAYQWLTQGYDTVANFPSLPFTILHTMPSDPWFGFHSLLVPFTYLGVFWGLKIWNVAAFILFALICRVVLKQFKVPLQWMWLWFIIFGSSVFYYRILIGRPFVIGHSVILLIFVALYKKKWLTVCVLAAFFSLFHQIFPILFIVVALAMLPRIFLSRAWHDSAIAFISVIVGSGIGILLHPEPIMYLKMVKAQFFILSSSDKIFNVGIEVTGASPLEFLNFFWILLAFLIPSLYVLIRWKLRDEIIWMVFVPSMIFGVMSFFSRRFYDYFWITGVLTIAIISSRLFDFHKEKITEIWSYLRKKYIILFFAFSVIVITATTIFESVRIAKESQKNANTYLEIISVIQRDYKKEQIIFNTSWDRYTLLYYFFPSGKYVAGMDPYMLYGGSSDLFYKWWHIKNGDEFVCGLKKCENGVSIFESLKNDFNSSYIIVEQARFKILFEYLESNTDKFIKILEKNGVIVYLIK